ncbi:MAG: hypothetical protein EXS09_17070 [Gemmataceae bacterium]|nr:hypothetical protein [Gemmataceae bacterium]
MATSTRYAPADLSIVDPKIAHPLGKLRGIIRRYVAIEGVLAVILFLAAWFWLAMLIDFGVFKLFAFDWALDAPQALRVIALVLAVAGLGALLVTKIIMRLTRDFSNSSLALVLEKRFPNILGDRLITAVQLSDLEWARKYGYSVQMIEKTISDVRQKIDQVPVKTVFNWKRLWLQAGVFLLLTFGMFLLSGVAVCAITKTPPKKFAQDFTDVAAILAERDLLMQNTPWPRRAYLEVLDFPGDEMRIGRDVPSPRVRIAAYKWVVADSSARVGWRPMTWADVQKITGQSAPALPLQPVRDSRFAVDYGPFLYGSAHPFTAPTLPSDVMAVPDELEKWPVDRVEQVFLENEDVTHMLSEKFSSDVGAIRDTLARLDEKAGEVGMSRTIRKLKIPDDVTLFYKGAKTDVDMKLRQEGNNEFSGTLSDLKESVRFYARGENYETPTKLITLVPPPMLTELKRDEYHPAYLYHKAPYAEAKDVPDELKPYQSDPRKLKGLKHILREQAVSLTGDKSRFDIPLGAEFVLYGKSDKKLQSAFIRPKPGKFPGIEAEVSDPPDINLPIIDGHGIRFEFMAANKMLVTRQTEFEIHLKDTDNVTSKRSVQIVVDEDRPPEVDVVVDVIRKVGSTYLCTPQALIPFTKESKIRDDKGLNRVEYVFSYSEIEPLAVTAKRAEYAMWFFNNVPVFPTIGDPLYRLVALAENLPRVRPNLATIDDRVPVAKFLEEFKARPLALESIQKKLDGPRPSGAEVTVINLVSYPPDAVREEQGFDLKKVAAGLRRTSDNEAQRTYFLTLNVTAIDTNVEADKPGIGQNKETLAFKLVSDGELLTEIAREEAGLADKLEDAIRRLTEVDNKLRSMVARFASLTTPESYVPEQTRANEVNEQLSKSKDVSAEVFTDYTRILQEFRVNRLPDHLITQMEEKIVSKLRDVLTNDFPQSEEAYGKLHGELNATRQPSAEMAFTAQSRVTVLLNKLRDIRAGIGQGLDLKKIISQVEGLIRDELLVSAEIDKLKRVRAEELGWVSIVPPPAAVTVTAGQKVTVRVPIVIGPAYNGTFTLKFEPSPGSDFKTVPSIKLGEEDKEFVLEITAGFAKGMFWVRVAPDVGPARDVKVIVK